MDFTQIIELTTTTAFPIAVVWYLLYERNQATKEMTKMLHNVTTAMAELKEAVKHRND